MALGVMILDMFKLGRFAKGRHIPIQVPHPVVQRRVARADIADVAFEMLDVDGIEADDGRVETDVGFGDLRSEVVRFGVRGEMFFCPVEGGEEGLHGFFIGVLGAGYCGQIKGVPGEMDVESGSYVAKPDL